MWTVDDAVFLGDDALASYAIYYLEMFCIRHQKTASLTVHLVGNSF